MLHTPRNEDGGGIGATEGSSGSAQQQDVGVRDNEKNRVHPMTPTRLR